MPRPAFGLCLTLWLAACAASQASGPPPEPYGNDAYAADAYNEEDRYEPTAPSADAPMPMSSEAAPPQPGFLQGLGETLGSLAPPSPAPARAAPASKVQFQSAEVGGRVQQQPPPPPPPSKETPQQAAAAPDKPMVVYQGWMRLRVKRLLEAQDQIEALAKEAGGHVASMSRQVVVVKVPGDDFEKAMELFAAVGELLDRRVQASDVTAQFLDMQARLQVLKEARERLLQLLEKALRKDEQLMILREIKRVSEQIEAMEAQLRTLQALVDFYTITIELVPVLDDTAPRQHCSPFDWVQGLLPHQATLMEGKDDVEMELPEGFVLFEDEELYVARAADTTVIRAAALDNEPVGDAAYWDLAVQHEMECRDEETAETGTAGALTYRVYQNKDVRPRAYLVAVGVFDDELAVVEVFFPDLEALARHRPAVLAALKTFKLD